MCSPAAVREFSCSDIGAITLAFRVLLLPLLKCRIRPNESSLAGCIIRYITSVYRLNSNTITNLGPTEGPSRLPSLAEHV